MSDAPLGDAPVSASEMPARGQRYDLLRAEGDYPVWSGLPQRSFLVCTTYRSGSNLLAEALLDLGGFGCPLDYFDEGLRLGLQTRWWTECFGDYLSALYRHRTDPHGSFGVKIDWPRLLHLSAEYGPVQALPPGNLLTAPQQREAAFRSVWKALQAVFPNPRFLSLTRLDKARQAVSWVRAKQSRRYWGIESAISPADQEASYDYDHILRALAGFAYSEECMERFFSWAGIEPVRIVYEKFTADYTGTVRRVAAEWDGRTNIAIRPPRLQRQSDAVSEAWVRRFLEEHREKMME